MFYESRKAKLFCLGKVDLHFQNDTGRSTVSLLKGTNDQAAMTPDQIMSVNYEYVKRELPNIQDLMNQAK